MRVNVVYVIREWCNMTRPNELFFVSRARDLLHIDLRKVI